MTPLKSILYFTLPYIISYFFQTLYGMIDLFIIGKYNGVEIITAVSIGSQFMHLLTVMVVGFSMGITVIIGRLIGAREYRKVSMFIGNSFILFSLLAVILMFCLFVFINFLVHIMSTPIQSYADTKLYLEICFLGLPFIVFYNIFSSIFRGIGDSKSPMIVIAIACVFNIILDFIFIGILGLGAFGAAGATFLSQIISVLVSIIIFSKQKFDLLVSIKDFRLKKEILYSLLKTGGPIAFQDGFIQIAFMIIIIIANKRGLNVAAAVGIVEKIIGILFIIPSALLSSVSVLVAQNLGANNVKRARQTLYYSIKIAIVFGILSVGLMYFFDNRIIRFFIKNENVVLLGVQYMRGYVWDCIFAGIHFCFSGYFCANGFSNISFFHNVFSIFLARIPLAYFASKKIPNNLFFMGLASPIGSIVSVIICVVVFVWMNRYSKKLNKIL
ncbi:MAG: MATE family efflux transporter [Pleomorphochaeta sp.]